MEAVVLCIYSSMVSVIFANSIIMFMPHLTNDKMLSPHTGEVPERCRVQERDCKAREEAECGQ